MENGLAKSAGAGAGSEQTVSVTMLDLTGLKCPLPVLKARRQISQMMAEDRLDVMADDPAAPLDFEHFCSTGNGHFKPVKSSVVTETVCSAPAPAPADFANPFSISLAYPYTPVCASAKMPQLAD